VQRSPAAGAFNQQFNARGHEAHAFVRRVAHRCLEARRHLAHDGFGDQVELLGTVIQKLRRLLAMGSEALASCPRESASSLTTPIGMWW
jgi:hypothetical protein